MGEFANYKINGIDFYSLKNEFSVRPSLMEVFSPDDWVAEPLRTADMPSYDYDSSCSGFVGYRTSCSVGIDRLEARGYTLARCKAELEKFVAFVRRALKSGNSNGTEFIDFYKTSFLIENWDEILSCFSNEAEYRSAFAQVFSNSADTEKTLYPDYCSKGVILKPANALAERMLGRASRDNGIFASISFVDLDPLVLLRLILDCIPSKSEIAYDFTSIYESWDGSLEADLLQYLSKEYFSSTNKIVVLTEGKTDDEFIKEALIRLKPNIAHLFVFFGNHENAKPNRGAAQLTSIGQSMGSVGFQEKIVFLFDNDTVGSAEHAKLMKSLPDNMLALRLPELEYLKKYPTEGPNGLEICDLNGRGSCIEHFMPLESLMDDSGNYISMYWSEYHNGAYQASFRKEDKEAIHRKTEKALHELKDCEIEGIDNNWSNTLLLLDYLVEESSKLWLCDSREKSSQN